MLKKAIIALTSALLISASMPGLSVPIAEAVSYKTVYLTGDGVQRTIYVSFSDTQPWDGCQDPTLSGGIQITYVANSTSYQVRSVRLYQSSTMKTSMTPEWMTWRKSNNSVWEGPVSMSPWGAIAPNGWATLNAPNFYNTSLMYSGNMSLSIAKPGGALCMGALNMTFFKR